MDGFQAAYNANTKNANVIKWLDTKSAAYVSHTQIDQATRRRKCVNHKLPDSSNHDLSDK